jgi:hypothetical protein
MKKIAQLVLVVILLSGTAFGQAFQKGNVNFDLGIGFGAYSTRSEFTTPAINILFITIPPTTVVKNDGAASTMVPISFEYGVSNKVGLGVQLGFSNYFIDNEDSTETVESVKSVDFAFKVNYHLSNSDKNDLFVGLALGGSSVNWKDLDGTVLKGGGSYVSLYLSDRLFFSEHFGVLFNLGYTVYNYTEITSNDNPSSLKWTLRGLNLGTGLALKF